MSLRSRSLLAAAGVALTAGLLPAVADAGNARIDVGGPGTYVVTADGSAVVTAEVTGRPFGGTSTTVLAAADGSLPVAGECEPATATFSVAGGRRDRLELVATGDVCGTWVQPPYVVTHVFTGRYNVTDASRGGLIGTDGFFEVRLAESSGSAYVFGIDT